MRSNEGIHIIERTVVLYCVRNLVSSSSISVYIYHTLCFCSYNKEIKLMQVVLIKLYLLFKVQQIYYMIQQIVSEKRTILIIFHLHCIVKKVSCGLPISYLLIKTFKYGIKYLQLNKILKTLN